MVDASSKFNGIQRRLATSSSNADVKWSNHEEKIFICILGYYISIKILSDDLSYQANYQKSF